MSCRNYSDEEIIDLTCSLTRADHRVLTNTTVINLDTDESFIELNPSAEKSKTRNSVSKGKTLKRKHTTHKKNDPQPSRSPEGGKKRRFGDCPICWDELGKNRLASTKCGHVFCLRCLERSLKIEKKCPTCRKVLKNKSSYHPLYLSSD